MSAPITGQQYANLLNEVIYRLGTALGLTDGEAPFDATPEEVVTEVEERLFQLEELRK